MIVGFAFASNALFNFLVGLLVAKFLGPEEFGRFAIASATAIIVNTGALDWIRLSAVRFYSARTRADHPEVRATLDACFTAFAAFVALGAVALSFSGLRLALSPGLAGDGRRDGGRQRPLRLSHRLGARAVRRRRLCADHHRQECPRIGS